jgi:hypothetical protein
MPHGPLRNLGPTPIHSRHHRRPASTTTQYSFLSGTNYTNANTYDAASNRTSLTAPDGSISTYGLTVNHAKRGP